MSYERELVHAGDGWELWRCIWQPGQCSPIHDHGAASGWNTVLAGRITEERYTHGVTGLQLVATCTRDAGAMDRFGVDTIHRVRALVASVTLHLYMPGYEPGRVYEAAMRPRRTRALQVAR